MPNDQIVDPGQLTAIPADNYNIYKDQGRVTDRTNVVDAPTSPNLLFNNNVPYTLDGRSKVNPLYANYINIMKNASVKKDILSQPYLTNQSKADRYNTASNGNYNPFDPNLENWYGENQSWLAQWGNHIGKGLVKAVGSFASSVMDIPNMMSAVGEGNIDKLWNNPTNTWATDMMDWSEKVMPNYKTNWESEHPFLNLIPFYGNSANSWGNVLEQTGFTVGAIGGAIVEDLGVGALTGGIGEVPLAAMQVNKAVYNLGKLIGKGEGSLEGLKNSIKSADELVKGLKGIDKINYAVRKGLWGANMITSGFSEASFEGIESYKTLSKDLNQEFLQNNGRLPSYEESKKIEDTAHTAANTRFLLNAALLAATNSIQWGSLLRPLQATKDVLEAEAKAGIKVALKEGSKDLFEGVAPKLGKLASFGKAVKNTAVATSLIESSSEGFEEGAQFVIQNGVDDYYTRKYRQPSIDFTNNFMKSFGTGLAKTLGTTEGWENIVYGLLGGAMYKGGEHLYYKAKKVEPENYKKQVEDVIKGLNSESLTGIFENKYGEAVAAASIEKDLNAAAKANNPFLFQNYKHEHFVNFVLSGIKQNKFETRMEQLDALKKLDANEFKNTFGIPISSESRSAVSEYVESLKKNAEYINDINKRVKRTFLNPFNYKGTGNYKNSESALEQNKENEKYIAFEGVKEQLVHNMSVAKNSADRINTLHNNLADIDPVIDGDVVSKISSDEGLKELKNDYTEKIKDLQVDLALAKTAGVKRDLAWYQGKAAQIDEILAEKDKDKQHKAYSGFVEDVFDKMQLDFAIQNNNNKKPRKVPKFDRLKMNDAMDVGKDIFYLQKRSDAAIDNYARLTTKGGFKSLFDSITALRAKVQETPVNLTPEVPQPQNPQEDAAKKLAEAKQGAAPTITEQGGGIIDSEKQLTPEQILYLNKILIEAVSGKKILTEFELESLGFMSIDDLKFEDPKVDLTKYTKVKSVEGRNFYISNELIDKAKKLISSPPPTSSGEGAPPIVPPNDPPAPINPKESSPLRTEDYVSKVFVPMDLKQAFNDAIFSGIKDDVRDKIAITVRPLSDFFQKEYDAFKAAGINKEIPLFPGVFVAKAPIDLSISHAGKEIAKVAFPERLLYRNGNTLSTVDKITSELYQQLTGRAPAQHAADVEDFRNQMAFKNYLALRYKNNDFKPITLSPEELKSLMDITITYGELDLVKTEKERPLYKDLKRNTISITMPDGKVIKTMAIVSVPKRYVSDTATRERTDFMNVIYGQNFYDTPNVDDRSVRAYLTNATDDILNVGSRYVGLVERPDGTIKHVAMRPAAMTESAKDNLFTSIKTRAKESIEANFVQATKEDSTGVLLVGNQEIYYKLPSDESKKFNDVFNTELNNNMFISDINGKSWFNLSVSPIGAVRLEIHEPVSNYRNTLYIAPQVLANIKDFGGLIEAFEKEITKKAKTDKALDKLQLKISGANFRQNIANDADIANAEELASVATTSTGAEVFRNGTMRLHPNLGNLTEAYKKAGAKPAIDKPVETPKEDTRRADIEKRRQEAISSITILEANSENQHYDSIIADIDGKEKEWNLQFIYNTSTEDYLNNIVKPEINAKYDAELASLTSGEQSVKDTIKPPVNPIEGLTSESTTEGGTIAPTQGIADVSSPVATSLQNQEDLGGIEFATVKDALASAGIAYKEHKGQTIFINIATNTTIDSLAGVSPIDLAKRMGLNVKPAQKKDNTEGFDFKLVETGNNELRRMIDVEAAKAYIYSILPSAIAVEDIDKVLENISVKGEVMGAFSNGVIYLNKNAEAGTEYHEAFHGVFRTLLNDSEIDGYLKTAQSQLYSKLRAKGQSINDLLKEKKSLGLYTNLSNAEAYDRLYEEFMADRFQDWKQKKDKGGLFDKLFSLIERFFKWLTRNKSDLDNLFYKIDKGGYKNSTIASNRFTQETNEESMPEFALSLIPARPGIMQVGKGQITIKRNLDAKTSKQIVQSVASYYSTYRRLQDNQTLTDEKLLDKILDDLKDFHSVNNPIYAGYSQEQIDKLVNSDESYIYTDEEPRELIKQGAKKYINSINYIEQFEEEIEEEAEQDTGAPSTGYDNRAENKGGFSSLPALLRQYISFTSYPVLDEFGNEMLLKSGIPVIATVDSLAIYYGLMRSVANITDPIKFFQRMIRFTDNNEQSRRFVEKFLADTGLNVDALMNENRLEATKNKALVELVKKGFNKFRIDYVFTEHDIKKAKTTSYHANRKNVENVQFDKWGNSFVQGYAEYSDEARNRIREQINTIRTQYFDERRINNFTSERLVEVTKEVKDALRGIGIQLSNDFIKYSLLAANAKKYDELNETYKKQGVELQFDDPANKFISRQDYQYVQIMKIGDEITLNRDFIEELAKTLAANTNPFFKEITKGTKIDEETQEIVETEEGIDTAMVGRLLSIARGNASFDETVGESSYSNAENKVVYAHQDGTYNIKYSYQLRDNNYRKQLRETGIREDVTAYRDVYDSEWLTKNFLLNSPQFEAIADNLLFQRIDGMRAVETNQYGRIITQEFRDQKEGVTYGGYSSREFIVNLMNLYISYSKTQKTGKQEIVTAPHLVRVLEASKTADTVNLPINLDLYRTDGATPKAVEMLVHEFNKEFNRIQRVSKEVGVLKTNLVESYHTGNFAEDGYTVTKGYRGLKFTDNITSLISKGLAEQLEAKARAGQEVSKEDVANIKADIKTNLDRIVMDTVNVMVKEGIIKKNNKGEYINSLLHINYFTGNTNMNLVAVNNPSKFVSNIGHVIVNDLINTLSYNQILHGDSALGLKNDGGIDAVKRAKGDNAAIVSMRTDLTDESLGITKPFTHSNVAIFKEPIGVDGTKIADAQMFTIVEGLRYTLWGLGRLTPRLAKVLDALQNNENIHALLDKNGKAYDAVFDGSKGLIRWDEMTNSLKLVYKDGKSYFKMSVVVLQPSLTSYEKNGKLVARPGWETLHNLRTKMEADAIHFAAPESASKMMTLDVSRASDFSDLKGHLFDNTYFGLQTENPSNKREITTPTQLIQLIDSEQDDDTMVFFDGKDHRVGDVKLAYQRYVSQKVTNDYDSARNDIYEIKDFEGDINKSISEGKVTPRLAKFQARAVETLEATGADSQLLDFFSLDENGLPKYDLNMSSTKVKFQQLYLSYFSKGVLSQKTPGYTVALMSGIDTKTIRVAKRIEKGVVVEWDHIRREHWDTNYNGVQGERILSSPDQVTEVGQHYVDELRYNVPEFDNDGNITGYYSEMMMPAHHKAFLEIPRDQNLPDSITKGFGVRIPSQDKHSFMSLRNIDFLPANLGSTAMFPKELIALSGGDFDLDKEYINRYDFYINRPDRGGIQFKKYGDETTPEGKWEEYKQWMGKNNKVIKSAVKQLISTDADYQALISKDVNATTLEDDIADLLDVASKLKKRQIERFYDKFITTALKQSKLPSTLEEFTEASKTKELNNGVIINKIVDSYVALLTNKTMQPIAKTPATLTALQNIQKEQDITLRDDNGDVVASVFSNTTNYPVDSMVGKYYAFRNNTTGKDNIGIDVNSNLIYSLLNKAGIELRSDHEGFTFDGEEFRSFAGDREFNLKTGKYDGNRTNDILSTLITSATDEAKEQLNALYNLSVDALKIVDYMVALKVPLKTAIYFVNQPAIRNYLDIKAVKQNTLQTTQEENLYRDDFKDEAISKLAHDIPDYKEMSDDALVNIFEKKGLIEVDCK